MGPKINKSSRRSSILHYSTTPLVHVALVAFIAFQLLDELVRLLFALAALFLNDRSQRGIDILGHASRVTANEELRALRIHPFPNLRGILQHLVLHVRFAFLIARPRAIATEKSIAPILFQFLAVKIIAVLVLRSKEEPVLALCPGGLALLQESAKGRDAGSWTHHDDWRVAVLGQPEL